MYAWFALNLVEVSCESQIPIQFRRKILCRSDRRTGWLAARPAHPPEHYLHWSRWRRRHQAIARQCHYQRRRERDH